jgi:hypothetical protein
MTTKVTGKRRKPYRKLSPFWAREERFEIIPRIRAVTKTDAPFDARLARRKFRYIPVHLDAACVTLRAPFK